MGTRTRGDGAGHDDGGVENPEQSSRTHHLGTSDVGPRTRPVLVLGAVVKHGAEHHHANRQQQVGADKPRVELAVDDDGAKDGVEDDTQNEQQADSDEVGAAGRAKTGGYRGDDRDSDEQNCDDSIGVLNGWVEAPRTGDLTLVTGGPVGTPEARTSEPNGRSGHDDEKHRYERRQREPPKCCWLHGSSP